MTSMLVELLRFGLRGTWVWGPLKRNYIRIISTQSIGTFLPNLTETSKRKDEGKKKEGNVQQRFQAAKKPSRRVDTGL